MIPVEDEQVPLVCGPPEVGDMYSVGTYICFRMPDLRRLDEEVDELMGSVQENTSCTRLDCCGHLHKLCIHNPCPQRWGPDSDFLQVGRRSLPPGWLYSSQKRGTSSQILARRHTQTNTLQSFGFLTSVTNK